MISQNLLNMVLESLEEECDRTVALLVLCVDSCRMRLGSFSNKYVSCLKYEATMKNLIDHELM